MGLGVGKEYHKESNLLGNETKVEGVTAAQGKTFGEGTKKATTEVGRIQPVRTSRRASETVDDLVHMLRSRRSGYQADILRPSHAASVTFENKMRGAAELCRAEGLAFVPIVAESLGGFHPVAIEQLKRIASALARHTAQEESEAIHHLLSRCSLLLQRGTASPLIIHFSHLPLY